MEAHKPAAYVCNRIQEAIKDVSGNNAADLQPLRIRAALRIFPGLRIRPGVRPCGLLYVLLCVYICVICYISLLLLLLLSRNIGKIFRFCYLRGGNCSPSACPCGAPCGLRRFPR